MLAAKVGYVRTADQQLAKMLHPCANGSFRKIAVQRFGFPLTTVVGRKANFANSASCASLPLVAHAASGTAAV